MATTTDHLNNQLPSASTLQPSPNQSAPAFVNIQGERSAFKQSSAVRKISKDLTLTDYCEEKISSASVADSSQVSPRIFFCSLRALFFLSRGV